MIRPVVLLAAMSSKACGTLLKGTTSPMTVRIFFARYRSTSLAVISAPTALAAKFRGNVRDCLPDRDAVRIMEIVADFENLENTGELTGILGQAAARG